MILYAYYNADLIDIAKGKWELSTGFVDDCMFVAIADTLDDVHVILKDMTERPNDGLKWSQCHNSPFELSKLAVMDFARTPWDMASSPLCINKVIPDGTITSHDITTINSYKFLGVFDPRFNWRAHVSTVIAKAVMWTQQLWRLANVTGGIPPGRAHQLYNTVAMPAFTYTSDIWYIPPFKLTHKRNSLGSVSVMKLLCSIQGKATNFITGALNGTTFDILEAHAHILPVDLLFRKTQMNVVTHICALPTSHTLAPLACHDASQFINRHRSPLHYLFHQTQLNPLTTKCISTFCRHPFHKTAFTSKISPSNDLALELAQKTHRTTKYKVYCDSSSFEGGVGAAAVLYKNKRVLKVRRAHLGTAKEHTVYEAKLTGVLLATTFCIS